MDLLPWDAPCKAKGQPKLTSSFALVETAMASMELLSQFLYAITAAYRWVATRRARLLDARLK